MAHDAMFIHSTGTGPFMWQKLQALLPAGWTVHTPANRGYPPFDSLPRGVLAGLDDDVESACQQLPAGVKEVHLGGHSYGALVALKMALQPRVPVRSLWLYEPVMYGALNHRLPQLRLDVAAEVERLFSHPALRMLDMAQGGNDTWLEEFVDHWNGRGAWKAMPENAKARSRGLGWKMYLEVRAQALDTMRFEDCKLQVPLTVMMGERTTAAAKEMARSLVAMNPQARLEVLDRQGHMAPAVAFDSVAPSVLKHLAQA